MAFPPLMSVPTAATDICTENLQLGTAIMAVTAYMGGREPSHGCRYCDLPLWLMWSWDNMPYAVCPLCGVEADQIDYCRTCDGPNCRNTGH